MSVSGYRIVKMADRRDMRSHGRWQPRTASQTATPPATKWTPGKRERVHVPPSLPNTRCMSRPSPPSGSHGGEQFFHPYLHLTPHYFFLHFRASIWTGHMIDGIPPEPGAGCQLHYVTLAVRLQAACLSASRQTILWFLLTKWTSKWYKSVLDFLKFSSIWIFIIHIPINITELNGWNISTLLWSCTFMGSHLS